MSKKKTTTAPAAEAKEEAQDINNKLASANEDLAKANAAVNEENEALRRELAAAKALAAKNQPVLRSDRFVVEEHQIGQDGVASFAEDGVLEPIKGENLDDPLVKEKAAMLAFMEEPVTVNIHEVSEDNADEAFFISVNNDKEFFRRGETKTVKRKFVEGLARARKTGYRAELRVDPITGVQEYVYPSKTGQRYPFSIIEDSNPKGRDWLTHTLRQP